MPDPSIWDGETFTLDLGTSQATFEFDVLVANTGAFDEDNFAVRPAMPDNALSIAAAIEVAIEEARSLSNGRFNPAAVTITGNETQAVVNVSADDEDGVNFISEINPLGSLNHGTYLPIEVSVTGSGVLEGWIDFNEDGDWDDPGEKILPMVHDPATQALREELLPVNQTGVVSNVFADTGSTSTRVFNVVVPPTTPVPLSAVTTYARFRVSREGGLDPQGLSLSGEVEDYAIRLLPGLPPEIQQAEIEYTFDEDNLLVANDAAGTDPLLEDGLLAGITDPNGDPIAIYVDDVVTGEMLQVEGPTGLVDAGELTLNMDGTFFFEPELDFNGTVVFSARVTDQQVDPTENLVNSTPLTVTLNVAPVNDGPVAIAPPVIVAREIDEDSVTVFQIDDLDPAQSLIEGKYVAGPDDELGQSMKIAQAGILTGLPPEQFYISDLGGNVTVSPDGSMITYTPPADYNQNVAPNTIDSFTYIVIDEPGTGFLAEQSLDLGTVNISFVPVNDAPVAANDTYSGDENIAMDILLDGPVDGIFDNDTGGPLDEDQNLTLKESEFPQVTLQGGTVTYVSGGNILVYTPAAFFSGSDQFTYTAVDSDGLEDSATVTVEVAGVNDSPTFLGVDGDPGVVQITRDEAKLGGETVIYDLNTWFSDPEGDLLTFSVATVPTATPLFTPSINGADLIMDLAAFENGIANLVVTADDGVSTPTEQTIMVTLNDTPDAPIVIGSLDPLTGNEDEQVIADLTPVFYDPDNDILTYRVAQLGTLINPTTSQIAAHELVQVIEFVADEMRITLQSDQSGEVNIILEADDQIAGTASTSFMLQIAAVPDFPVAENDEYEVSIGSAFQVTNVNHGLLGNDFDPDGDVITYAGTIAAPTLGSVVVNLDGTFTYTNISGTVGGTDTFTYTVVDTTSRESNVATVTFNLQPSEYQNPTSGFENDVNADGFTTALDVLRIINFLDREGAFEVPVSQITTAPPDYLDTNGNGQVTVGDALQVLNALALQGGSGEGEFVNDGPAALGVTSSFVAASRSSLPVRNMELVSEF